MRSGGMCVRSGMCHNHVHALAEPGSASACTYTIVEK